jgi:3',5'-cyclic AMP phosphodiesterase CpdA
MDFKSQNRREFLQLMGTGVGGVVFASGLGGCASSRPKPQSSDDFYFLQLSDTHWGYQGPANPEADLTLKKTVQLVNALTQPPDFVVFTGDLTHSTDDANLRRKRMSEFKQIVGDLKCKDVRFMAGEHDASLDAGEAYREFFGDLHYVFDHKGIHFVVIDNVSDPGASIGQAQLAWLGADLQKVEPDRAVVVLTHRPLFPLYPSWDWTTRDGDAAMAVIQKRRNVTVFYGHIHQEHHQVIGGIAHHSARSLIFPLPAPGSVPKRAPLPWDPAHPNAGLGYRSVSAAAAGGYQITERSIG